MAAAVEQDLLAFLADLGNDDDTVDAEDPVEAEEANGGLKPTVARPSLLRLASNKEPREHETVSGIRILKGLFYLWILRVTESKHVVCSRSKATL